MYPNLVYRSIFQNLEKIMTPKLFFDETLFYKKEKQGEESIEINEDKLNQLLNAASKIESGMNQFQAISPLDILRWPGVQSEISEDLEPIHERAISLLNEALEQLLEAREREGADITKMITSRCGLIEEQMELAKERLPEVPLQMREKLQKKISDLKEDIDPARLEQELVFLLQKMDVEEELDRLESHVKEVRRILEQKEPVGRRLDFLMQELNREANTLGSKSADIQTTNISVELKVLIEQMREQIQNIE